jgi:hypothetical protein
MRSGWQHTVSLLSTSYLDKVIGGAQRRGDQKLVV